MNDDFAKKFNSNEARGVIRSSLTSPRFRNKSDFIRNVAAMPDGALRNLRRYLAELPNGPLADRRRFLEEPDAMHLLTYTAAGLIVDYVYGYRPGSNAAVGAALWAGLKIGTRAINNTTITRASDVIALIDKELQNRSSRPHADEAPPDRSR